jgi:hypothetical protein
MNNATLRAFVLNVEQVVTDPGIQSDNEDDDNGNSAKKQKPDLTTIKKYTLEGSQSPVCSFCGITGHTEPHV